MLVWPASRLTVIAVLRSRAMFCGPAPVRIWEWSSPNVTSRTQCSTFSICQCPRSQVASSTASAYRWLREVIAYTVSAEVFPVAMSVRRRTTFIARAAPGNNAAAGRAVEVDDGGGAALVAAVSARRPRVLLLGGGRPRQGGQRPMQGRLVGLHGEQVVRAPGEQVVRV